MKPTIKWVVKCKGNILSNQMWGKSCSRNVLYHSYPKLTPVTQSRSHILRNKKIWIPDRLVKNRTYNGVFDSFVFSLRFMVKSHYNQFSANQIWTDSNIRFVELLNFCITFVLPTLIWKYWEILRIQESLWISVMIWLITQFVQIPCQICLTSDLWAFSHVDPASTTPSPHWAMVHDLIILSGNYFQYWKKCSQTTRESCSCMKIFSSIIFLFCLFLR